MEEKIYKKIAVIGLGLIGGSLAMEIKKRKLADLVIGISRRNEVVSKAKEIGAVDWGFTDLTKGVKDVDLIFICTPIFSIIEIFKKISGFLKPEAVVTDVGSTKSFIVKEISKICPENIYFIGGHPMAGSEQSGFASARLGLFEGVPYFLTPQPKTLVDVCGKLAEFIEKLGAKAISLEPEEHDRIVAGISHLPYLTAVSLVNSILELGDSARLLKFAATGFRDTTRIAASPPGVWQEICLSNREEITRMLEILEKKIAQVKKALSKNDAASLSEILEKSFEARKELFK